ncbi:hypothetical protein DERP_014126 [Dermatophagoides pteronyssinus]|uniref:Uncharacterized protein n=1 Tax=Dermatophagoides pteronyssinus TaxID=6956 RepID=A0ABQ8IXQ1_DERPT|nr:hypothetical protein DERP_014126 [Dermatophagoides pteronyssinus]
MFSPVLFTLPYFYTYQLQFNSKQQVFTSNNTCPPYAGAAIARPYPKPPPYAGPTTPRPYPKPP